MALAAFYEYINISQTLQIYLFNIKFFIYVKKMQGQRSNFILFSKCKLVKSLFHSDFSNNMETLILHLFHIINK